MAVKDLTSLHSNTKMKFINHITINELYRSCYIDPVDMDAAKDQGKINKLISELYTKGDPLYLICKKRLAPAPLDIESESVQIHFFEDDLNKETNCCAYLTHSTRTFEIYKRFWHAFDQVRLFKPYPDLSWEKLLSYEHNIFQEDKEGLKMFSFNFFECIVIKGLAGESLIVNYRKDFPLPSINSLI
jgi:hypothetical protein